MTRQCRMRTWLPISIALLAAGWGHGVRPCLLPAQESFTDSDFQTPDEPAPERPQYFSPPLPDSRMGTAKAPPE